MDIILDEDNAPEVSSPHKASRWKVKYILPPHLQRFCLRRFWHKTVFLEKTGDLICFGGFNRFNNPPLVSYLTSLFPHYYKIVILLGTEFMYQLAIMESAWITSDLFDEGAFHCPQQALYNRLSV